jgi:hypothetical protein
VCFPRATRRVCACRVQEDVERFVRVHSEGFCEPIAFPETPHRLPLKLSAMDPPQRWVTLPTEHRRKTRQTLSRIVAQQLHAPRSPREVSHEEAEPSARDYAVALGWPATRVWLIDEDQGQSGTSAQSHHGFQRLHTEVTMNHVGLVLGLEMSRLAQFQGLAVFAGSVRPVWHPPRRSGRWI